MECISCHQKIPADSQFCIYCGASQETNQRPDLANEADWAEPASPREAGQQRMATPEVEPKDLRQRTVDKNFSKNIIAGPDGVVRWVYEMSMWKNSTIPKTVAKVVVFASMVPALLVTFLTLEEGIGEAAKVFLGVAGVVLGIMVVLFLMAYALVSVMYGGKYCVAFEMDHKGVKHIHMQKQYRKNQVLSMITVLAGIAAGSPQTAGAGLLAGARNTSYSAFTKVIGIKADPKRNVIYVNEIANKNQVYVADEDFDTVLDYLTTHCKKAKVSFKS